MVIYVQELHRLLEFKKDFWLAYFNVGVIYTNKGIAPEAITALEKMLSTRAVGSAYHRPSRGSSDS
jgi:hypothetical protein